MHSDAYQFKRNMRNSIEGTAISSEKPPSLLLLNDDCLMQIFKCLELLDFVNLSKTCVRLKNIAAGTFNPRFNIVRMNDIADDSDYPKQYPMVDVTRRQFCDFLTVIGWRVQSVETYEGRDYFFREVTHKCENVTSLSLKFIESPTLSLRTCPHLQGFKTLTKLEIIECEIAKDILRQIFLNNPGIVTFRCDWMYKGLVKLLKLLPKLKTLELERIETLRARTFRNFFHLKEVKEFSFYSRLNCNKFVVEIAAKWSLVSLDIQCDFDDETFDSLQLFENLENLRIRETAKSYVVMPERTVFPPKLKSISFNRTKLTFRKLASIVDELKLLKRINVVDSCLMDVSHGKLFHKSVKPFPAFKNCIKFRQVFRELN